MTLPVGTAVVKRSFSLAYLILLAAVSILEAPDYSQVTRIPSRQRALDSFSELDAYLLFETRRGDLHRMYNAFQIPERVIFYNGGVNEW